MCNDWLRITIGASRPMRNLLLRLGGDRQCFPLGQAERCTVVHRVDDGAPARAIVDHEEGAS
jgi:hypothetical protein